ncbi:hypothetical protein SCG7086_AK_00240 [Chlamydiales bacterium SCGC AG-110-P3]|nr:hypothetical protein SCG7086_AK_00240 [Chlamydiales bacterium SCGC AG-110-P3]
MFACHDGDIPVKTVPLARTSLDGCIVIEYSPRLDRVECSENWVSIQEENSGRINL